MLNLFQHLFNIIMNHFEKTGQFARFFLLKELSKVSLTAMPAKKAQCSQIVKFLKYALCVHCEKPSVPCG